MPAPLLFLPPGRCRLIQDKRMIWSLRMVKWGKKVEFISGCCVLAGMGGKKSPSLSLVNKKQVLTDLVIST